MKVISWNCRGIANRRVRTFVKELLTSSKADALCLLEIRSPKAERMIGLASCLGYTNHFIVDPLGFAGGLLLFWREDRIDLEIISHNSQAIHTKVNNRPGTCLITFSYVRPNPLAKNRFWNYCKTIANAIQDPWMVIGDLNDIASVEEQWGSSSINNTTLQTFVDAYSDCGLIDPGSSGPKFTWGRAVGNRMIQMRKLDRALWNIEAQVAFPEAKIMVLSRLCSDHNPIMFLDEAGNPPDRNLRPVRFEAAWLPRGDYRTIWKEAANKPETNMVEIINNVTCNSITWNKNVFGNIFKRKRRLEARILGIQCAHNYSSSWDLQRLEKQLSNELSKVLDQEESFWF